MTNNNEDAIDRDSLEELFSVARIYSNQAESWLPAILDKEAHDVDPVWVAGVLYLIFDRYLSCVPDGVQIEFQSETLDIFNEMLESGAGYVHKVDEEEED